jgi:hypothetical protein
MRIGDGLRRFWRAIETYADHPDPLVVTCNWIALIVASNQPLYPLYVQWVAGGGGHAAMLTWLSTPLFVLAPLAARHSSRLGRMVLPLAGIANSLLALALFGRGAGMALFLAPCLVIAGLAFRPDERRWSYALIAACVIAYFALRRLLPAPVVSLSAAGVAGLLEINIISAGCLLILVGLSFSSARADASEVPRRARAR